MPGKKIAREKRQVNFMLVPLPDRHQVRVVDALLADWHSAWCVQESLTPAALQALRDRKSKLTSEQNDWWLEEPGDKRPQKVEAYLARLEKELERTLERELDPDKVAYFKNVVDQAGHLFQGEPAHSDVLRAAPKQPEAAAPRARRSAKPRFRMQPSEEFLAFATGEPRTSSVDISISTPGTTNTERTPLQSSPASVSDVSILQDPAMTSVSPELPTLSPPPPHAPLPSPKKPPLSAS